MRNAALIPATWKPVRKRGETAASPGLSVSSRQNTDNLKVPTRVSFRGGVRKQKLRIACRPPERMQKRPGMILKKHC